MTNIKEPERPTIEIVSEDVPLYLKALLFLSASSLFGVIVLIVYNMMQLILYQ